MIVYQRRTLANITGSMTNNVRPQVPNAAAGSPTAGLVPSYPRMIPAGQPSSPAQGIAPAPHYQRPHLFGHDINTMCKCLFSFVQSYVCLDSKV